MNFKKIILPLFAFAVFFLSLQYADANVIDSTGGRCRNVSFYHISHNQVFSPGDSINFGFTAECKNPNIDCGIVKVTARLTNDLTLGFFGGSVEDIHLVGHGHNGGATVSCTNLGGSWSRIRVANMTAEIPSNLSGSYSAAAIYPVFYRSNGTGGWNIGSLGEHIQAIAQTCTCSADYYRVNNGQTSACVGAKGICGSNCKKIKNTCGPPIFAPAKTNPAWNSFIGTHPGCIELTDCQ